MNGRGQYPPQPAYPAQPPGNPVCPQTLHLPQVPPCTDASPACSEVCPTGYPPGTAQLAVMQGAHVLVTQWKRNFSVGGSDGDYTIENP
ncbi:DAZ-associated protein 2-like [Balaenoptera musculus]|uniref:DAZ-associated protein 2 n=1 Tax=Balaenoptera musculus TaxID=9771 RepID=A0A8B8V8V5_BALMU|nr:DAZ-associated protein 2-like [Balaenoptera musculus]